MFTWQLKQQTYPVIGYLCAEWPEEINLIFQYCSIFACSLQEDATLWWIREEYERGMRSPGGGGGNIETERRTYCTLNPNSFYTLLLPLLLCYDMVLITAVLLLLLLQQQHKHWGLPPELIIINLLKSAVLLPRQPNLFKSSHCLWPDSKSGTSTTSNGKPVLHTQGIVLYHSTTA